MIRTEFSFLMGAYAKKKKRGGGWGGRGDEEQKKDSLGSVVPKVGVCITAIGVAEGAAGGVAGGAVGLITGGALDGVETTETTVSKRKKKN